MHEDNNKDKVLDNAQQENDNAIESPQRRQFINDLCALSATGIATTVIGAGAVIATEEAVAGPLNPQPGELLAALEGSQRQQQVFNLRKQIAQDYKNEAIVAHPNNGDDALYLNRIGSFTKSMPHNALGEVDTATYNTYLSAIASGDRALFDAIPTPGNITLRNIENIWSIDYLGPDSHSLTMPPAPAFASAEQAGEFVELYWQALTRDIPFTEYDSHLEIQAAADDLSTMSDFRGPKDNLGKVTPATLFRGMTPGDLTGPFISQFLTLDIPYGAYALPQRIITAPADQNYVTDYATWLAQQNGFVQNTKTNDPIHRYIRCGRDMGEFVGRDFLYQPYLNAALILTRSLKTPYDPNNPYIKPNKPSQHGHNTFGAHHVYNLVVRVANIAQKNAWYQKWAVHRRLRPEEFGGRVHNHMIGDANYPIHSDLLTSPVLAAAKAKWGSYLLAQQYPEGVPPHPAYPAGHATIAGACATVLKAVMDENAVIESPMVATADGVNLMSYSGGETLTVGNELNKLAANIAIGRDTAGVHWRSDSIEGMKLGEEVAIKFLRDQRRGYYEDFAGFHLTKFDGTQIIV